MAPIFEGVGRPVNGSLNSVISVGEEALLALAGSLPRGVCGAGRFWRAESLSRDYTIPLRWSARVSWRGRRPHKGREGQGCEHQ